MINFVLSFQDTNEFDLQFDKVFKWFAINLQERQNFLVVLWKVGHYFMQLNHTNISTNYWYQRELRHVFEVTRICHVKLNVFIHQADT